MLATRFLSTVYWTFLASAFQVVSACLPASDFLVLVYEAFLS
jgi:hypothetical protein